MISQRALNYAKVLFSLKLQEETINQSKTLLGSSELLCALESPVVKKQEKEAVIATLFPEEIGSFLKELCANKAIGLFGQISDAYDEMKLEQSNLIRAKLAYVTKPGEEELGTIKTILCEKYKKTGVLLDLEEDASLVGGYVLYVQDTVYDKSIKGAISEMQKTLIRR